MLDLTGKQLRVVVVALCRHGSRSANFTRKIGKNCGACRNVRALTKTYQANMKNVERNIYFGHSRHKLVIKVRPPFYCFLKLGKLHSLHNGSLSLQFCSKNWPPKVECNESNQIWLGGPRFEPTSFSVKEIIDQSPIFSEIPTRTNAQRPGAFCIVPDMCPCFYDRLLSSVPTSWQHDSISTIFVNCHRHNTTIKVVYFFLTCT